MTIFEQQIDPSQVHMAWVIPIALIIIFGGFILMGVITVSVASFIWQTNKLPTIINIIIAGILCSGSVFLILIAATNPLPIDKLTKPEFDNPVFIQIKEDNKPLTVDKYREEINTAVKAKLGDYTVPDYATDNPQESILYGGDTLQSVATTKDGKTYTLKPDWDYDRSTHTVKLSVTIKEGYHPGAM